MLKLLFMWLLSSWLFLTNAQWNIQNSYTTKDLTDISTSDNFGMITGYWGLILKTTDKGESWFLIQSPRNKRSRAICAVDNNTFYIAGQDSFILKTTNGGINWQLQPLGREIIINDIQFYNQHIGYAVGSGGTIIKTTDGGNNWIQQNSGTTKSLITISIINQNKIVIGGKTNLLLSSINGGYSWHSQPINAYELPGFIILDENNMFYLAADYSYGGYFQPDYWWTYLYKSTDSGDTWSQLYKFENFRINSICFIDNNIGFAVGNNESVANTVSKVFKTIDGGTNWSETLTGTTNLNNISFFDALNGNVIGMGGVLYLTTTGGVTSTEDEPLVLDQFYLHQNYPNPFNPSTIIKFSVPAEVKSQSSMVNLKIYDVLGNEIAMLVNETKQPGEYEVEFDAAKYGLSSGVYFYKLTAGGFVETKKMVMLK